MAAPTLTFDRRLAELGADLPLLRWIRAFPDLASAWTACERGDWLLWLAARLARADDDRRAVVSAAAACARLALDYAPRGEPGPETALMAAERWARGEVAGDIVHAAAHGAAYSVMGSTNDERSWAAASAAWAAAWSAVWFDSRNGTIGAAQAARQAAEAAAEALGPRMRDATRARCAAIVRERVAVPRLPPEGGG